MGSAACLVKKVGTDAAGPEHIVPALFLNSLWTIVTMSLSERYTISQIRKPPPPQSVRYHEGDRYDFLDRHLNYCARVKYDHTKSALREFAHQLFKIATDERMLRIAMDHLEERGGDSPGPDGLKLLDMDDRDKWDECRALRDDIREGTYRPGPERVVMIDKASGNGKRPLTLQNVTDRVVQRAVLETIQPLLDPLFVDGSYGFRPRVSRFHALAHAEKFFASGHCVWVCEDIRDAFLNVPIGRLVQLFKRYLAANDLTAFVSTLLGGASMPGLRQGAPLSPILLNLYLHHHLDRLWKTRHAETPLIRVADDLLLVCESLSEAKRARDALAKMLRPTGLALKVDPTSGIRTLSKKSPAIWMGYVITKHRGQLRCQISERAWHSLDDGLRAASANTTAQP